MQNAATETSKELTGQCQQQQAKLAKGTHDIEKHKHAYTEILVELEERRSVIGREYEGGLVRIK